MKKVIFALAIALLSGSAIAQTPADKEAAKAAKAALKEATKAANKELSDGMDCAQQVQMCQQAIQMEQQNGDAANKKVIAENETKIQTLSLQGIDHIMTAMGTGYIKDSKKFEAYQALDNMATVVLNEELVKASKKEPFDRVAMGKAVFALTDACHGQIAYGKVDDQMQNVIIQSVRLKFPKTHAYYAYLCQFCIEAKDLDGAQKALDAYIDFPNKYPEIADNELVKNPEYPAEQFAFNIFYTAFNDKNVELMDKYYEQALLFDNKESHSFVLRAKAQLLKDQGKTEEWMAALKDMIASDPNGELGEIAMQQLMSHFEKHDKDAMDAYTVEMVEKYPDSRMANYCRGFAYYSKNQFEDALKYFQKSVEIDPNYADGVYNCGYCQYQHALEKARAISGKQMKSQAAINAAEAEVKALFSKAAPYFERYRELDTNADATKWADPLKIIYNNIGEKDKAAEMEAYLK